MCTDTDIRERVQTGANWLDASFPGWEYRIDINTLNLMDGVKCVCGQVFANESNEVNGYHYVSGYDYAWDNLFTEGDAWIQAVIGEDDGDTISEQLGFSARCSDDWIKLQVAWTDLLQDRATQRELLEMAKEVNDVKEEEEDLTPLLREHERV